MKIAIIGAGNMGGALVRGFAKCNKIKKEDITVSDPDSAKLHVLKADFPQINIENDNNKAIQQADVVMLVVKPWLVENVVNEIKHNLDYDRQAVVCVAGGVDTSAVLSFLKRSDNKLPAVYHAIPNIAAAENVGMTFITGAGSTPNIDSTILSLFQNVGDVMFVEERLMNTAMALSSCGIAYALRYIRAASEGGVELGLFPDDAQRIVMQTLKGAVALLEAGTSHPEQEIDKVTTPGGFTIRGLNAMEEAGFTTSVIKGLKASV